MAVLGALLDQLRLRGALRGEALFGLREIEPDTAPAVCRDRTTASVRTAYAMFASPSAICRFR